MDKKRPSREAFAKLLQGLFVYVGQAMPFFWKMTVPYDIVSETLLNPL